MAFVLSYLNTILFGLVSLGICVLMMFLIAMPSFQGYVVFLLTVGIGMSVVTLMAFSAAVNADTNSQNVNATSSNLATLSACPDYWSSTWGTAAAAGPSSGSASASNILISCSSTNQLLDPITGNATQINLIAWVNGVDSCSNTNQMPQKISLGAQVDNQNDATICAFVQSSTNGTTLGTQYIPWTRVRPFCPANKPYPQ